MGDSDKHYLEEVVGRCVTCGFLAAHRDRWHEVTNGDRARGNLTGSFGTGYDSEFNTRPACFRHAFNLGEEWETEFARTKDMYAASLAVIERYRYCERWQPYVPGFSPKEHLEELRARELEEDRQRFQREMEEGRQRTQREITAVEGKFQAFSKRWTIIAVVVGVVAAVIGVTGVIFTALGYFAVHH